MFVALEKIVSDVRFELESKNFRRRGHRAYPIAHTGLRNCGCVYRYTLRSETGIHHSSKGRLFPQEHVYNGGHSARLSIWPSRGQGILRVLSYINFNQLNFNQCVILSYRMLVMSTVLLEASLGLGTKHNLFCKYSIFQ